jgi:hypothetical protein
MAAPQLIWEVVKVRWHLPACSSSPLLQQLPQAVQLKALAAVNFHGNQYVVGMRLQR